MEIINKSVCRGVAGRRAKDKPDGVVIHNDAGSINATAKQYVNSLACMTNSQLANGFAHYYIDRNTIARTEDTFNMAWHTANANGNAYYVGYEVCQSIGASEEDFLANEQATLRQAAEDLKYWGHPANRNTVKLHNQFVATACPHRSQEIHGKGVACQDYFIREINKFMDGGTSPNPEPSKPAPPSIDQGPGIPVNKWIQITDRNYVTYNSFGFDQMLTGKQLFGMRFNVRTEYKHKNGATYYSLFSEHGEWFGYINAKATKASRSPQGTGKAVNYVGTVAKKGWSIYSGFDWKEIMKSDVIYDKPVRIKTEYNHENGSKYLSLYDGNEKWLGYVNADVLKK